MGHLREKVEAELEQVDRAVGLLPEARKVSWLSVLELGGTASLLSSVYHGIENIMKQALVSAGVALPFGPAWHRDLLQSACEHGNVSTGLRDRLAPFMAFRHFFAHAYGFDLDPRRMEPLLREAPAISASFEQEVNQFVKGIKP